MSWSQTRNPNLDPYIIQPDGHGGVYTLTDWFGWCLAYVQTSFGTGWGGNTAWECWENHTVNRHPDWDLPTGVFVPIFFSGYHGQGHAAIYKDGQVWSSPIEHKPTADIWPSIAAVQQHYGVTYVGWAEGIGGTSVVSHAADVAPPPPPPKYTVTENYANGKQIKLNKQPTNLWGMNFDFDYMSTHPVEVHNQGEIWTVTNKVHHIDGYDYYRRDGQVDGFNVADCDDYTPPYIPPAAPLSVPKAAQLVLTDTFPAYATQSDAQLRITSVGTFKPGNYFIWQDEDKVKLLTPANDGKNGLWYSILDKPITPVAVVADKPTVTSSMKDLFTPFSDGKSRTYISQTDMYLFDLAAMDAKGINIDKDEKVPIFGYIKKSDGAMWLIPRLNSDTIVGQTAPKAHYYGIPTTNVYTGLPNMKSQQYLDALDKAEEENRLYRKGVGHETTSDRIYFAEQLIARAVKSGVRFIDGIIPISKLKAQSQKENKK